MRSFWIMAGVGLLLALPLWAADPVVGSPLQAVWKEQHLEFAYIGRTARYSCQGLRDKMRSLLVGTHQDGKLVYMGRVGTGYTAAVRTSRSTAVTPVRSGVCSTPHSILKP